MTQLNTYYIYFALLRQMFSSKKSHETTLIDLEKSGGRKDDQPWPEIPTRVLRLIKQLFRRRTMQKKARMQSMEEAYINAWWLD